MTETGQGMEKDGRQKACTYNLAFFLGPGFPLGLGNPSGPSCGPAHLFTPFFLTPSVGGSISDGTGVPFGTGVLGEDSVGAFSPFELEVVAGIGFERVDDESFDGDSSLTTSLTSCLTGPAGSNRWSSFDDSFKETMRVLLDDFRRVL